MDQPAQPAFVLQAQVSKAKEPAQSAAKGARLHPTGRRVGGVAESSFLLSYPGNEYHLIQPSITNPSSSIRTCPPAVSVA